MIMKNFIRIYILISIAILIFSICEIFSGFGGLAHKTKSQYFTMEQLSNPNEEAEQLRLNLRTVLNDKIQYSCIYGGYAILNAVFGCVALSKTKKK